MDDLKDKGSLQLPSPYCITYCWCANIVVIVIVGSAATNTIAVSQAG